MSKEEQSDVENTNYLIALAALFFIALISVLPRRLSANPKII